MTTPIYTALLWHQANPSHFLVSHTHSLLLIANIEAQLSCRKPPAETDSTCYARTALGYSAVKIGVELERQMACTSGKKEGEREP